MLKIKLTLSESYDEKKQEFVTEEYTLKLNHSLVSVHKWESKWEKPFLSPDEKNQEETLHYIECMILNDDVPENVLGYLTDEHLEEIRSHIGAKMSATWFVEKKEKPNRDVITSELIYYWMFTLTIPKECETWHLNQLLTLVRVFSEKNAPEKKMSREEQMARQRSLNAQRKAKLGSRG